MSKQIKFVLRSLKIAAGKRVRVNEVASFFMLVSNTGSSDVKISIDDSPLSDCPVSFVYQERKDDEFYEHIDFMNPNAAEITIQYIMSIGLVQNSPIFLQLADILAEMAGAWPAVSEIWDTEMPVNVAAGQVMAANISRHSGSVQAKSTNTGVIYIGYDGTVLPTKWIAELQPGQSFSFDDWLGEIHAITLAGAQMLGYGEH